MGNNRAEFLERLVNDGLEQIGWTEEQAKEVSQNMSTFYYVSQIYHRALNALSTTQSYTSNSTNP